MKIEKMADTGLSFDEGLCCPECGCVNIHQGAVEIFNREKEDDPSGLHVHVTNTQVIVNNDMGRNPSGRRDGLIIYFHCELCPARLQLAIWQHKGTTFVRWR